MSDNSKAATPVWPIEDKVKAATGGAGVGVILAQLLDWLVDMYVITPHHLDGNPVVVTLALTVAASAGVAFAGGYLARHNVRPPDAAIRLGREALDEITARLHKASAPALSATQPPKMAVPVAQPGPDAPGPAERVSP